MLLGEQKFEVHGSSPTSPTPQGCNDLHPAFVM